MKKGTKVNTRNMYAVAGKINKFLSKPTEFGRKGRWEIFNGYCQESYYRKECREYLREADEDDYFRKEKELFCEDNLLQVCDNGVCGVIPIDNGAHVFISGDAMVITRHDTISRAYDTSKKKLITMPMFDKNSVYVFRRVAESAEHNVGVVKNNLRNVYSHASEEEMYVERDMLPCEDMSGFRSLCMDIAHKVYEFIDGLDVSEDTFVGEISLQPDASPDAFTVTVKINVGASRKEPVFGVEGMSFTWNEEEFASTTDLCIAILYHVWGDEEGYDGYDGYDDFD